MKTFKEHIAEQNWSINEQHWILPTGEWVEVKKFGHDEYAYNNPKQFNINTKPEYVEDATNMALKMGAVKLHGVVVKWKQDIDIMGTVDAISKNLTSILKYIKDIGANVVIVEIGTDIMTPESYDVYNPREFANKFRKL